MTHNRVEDFLCSAICHRLVIKFHYHGGIRIVEPHSFGRDKHGQLVLHGFQQYGYSKSKRPHHWKRFKVREMKDLEVLEKIFKGPRPGYTGQGQTLQDVYCCLREDGPPSEAKKKTPARENRRDEIPDWLRAVFVNPSLH